MLGVAALGLSACATSLSTTVSRYQAMPAAQGQTFFVVPGEGMAANGGLEFQRYAGLVAQQLQARGYSPAAGPESATMLVHLGYSVDHGQTRIVEDPFLRSRYGYGGFGSPFYYPRFGFRSAFSYGWNDPFWYGGGVDSYVEYHSEIDLHIRARGSNQPLYKAIEYVSPETAARRRVRRPTVSMWSCPAWSKRCSPASPGAAARPSE